MLESLSSGIFFLWGQCSISHPSGDHWELLELSAWCGKGKTDLGGNFRDFLPSLSAAVCALVCAEPALQY